MRALGLHGVGHQLEAEDVGAGQALALAQPGQELPRLHAPDGVQVPLRVDVAALAVLVEVDRQVRHPQDRLVDADEVFGAVAEHDPT